MASIFSEITDYPKDQRLGNKLTPAITLTKN
jgi:hypothetical protein